MKVDYLVAEIGSTTTLVTAFNVCYDEIGQVFVDIPFQGNSCTTVTDGDVTIGLKNAVKDIENQIHEPITWEKMLATSSAAGGLRITVHGLMEHMTVKAAREAALGAGGIIKMVTAGKMRRSDLKRIHDIKPNMIMIAGGTDYGERETALYNAELISAEKFSIPIVYCGNSENREEIKEIFEGQEIYLIDNVYPSVDILNVEPARKIIQEAFEKNIVKAPGMSKIKEMVNGSIMPTPGAVMESSKLLYDIIGDLVVLDVGGATTDVHSVTEGSSVVLDMLINPEPKAKRTVEGDLGVFINSKNVIDLLDDRDLSEFSTEYIKEHIKPIPKDKEDVFASRLLTKKAIAVAIDRHVGFIKRKYDGDSGFVAYGKDLSEVKYIIGTGGALTRLPNGEDLLLKIRYLKDEVTMLPKKGAKVLIDKNYIMACAGVLSRENKEVAKALLIQSLGITVGMEINEDRFESNLNK
ncbi:GlmL-related ornithine degradation protein [Clostridium estertheticum]|uniref:GlmL-related ornithine degradation protein n=1 Tax=Clostridium estertheticum TaxID=238834 RepID=UPI001C6EB0C7|nr:GlmL-related ornithine degradation protein [Clostridium estertheticum]MBW9154163.1 glutamate mutase L [Clostridium estertheticum]WLC85009.1 glutamate mutase L [Clostridium estertheticum]